MDKVTMLLFNCVKKCNQNELTQIPPVLYKDLSEGKLKTLNEYIQGLVDIHSNRQTIPINRT